MKTPPIKLNDRQKSEVIAAFEEHHEVFAMLFAADGESLECIFDAMADMQRIRDEFTSDEAIDREIEGRHYAENIRFDDASTRLINIIKAAREASAPVAKAGE